MNPKLKTKYIVDSITFISFIITAITGLALKFFMPSGVRQGRLQEFLGIQKGAWTGVHDWAGVIMIIFALIHIILYWNIFSCMTKSFFKKDEECEIKTEDTKQ